MSLSFSKTASLRRNTSHHRDRETNRSWRTATDKIVSYRCLTPLDSFKGACRVDSCIFIYIHIRMQISIYAYVYIYIYLHIVFNRELAINEQKEKREKNDEENHEIIARLIQMGARITSSYHLLLYHHHPRRRSQIHLRTNMPRKRLMRAWRGMKRKSECTYW